MNRPRSLSPLAWRRAACAALSLAGLVTAVTAESASPEGASAAASAVPRVLNRQEITASLLGTALDSGLVASGTVFVPIRIGVDGGVESLDAYGAPAQNPELARRVRRATESLRVSAPAEWRASHPDGAWAVFWVFDTGPCLPTGYDTPARVIAILVCTPVENDRVQRARSSVHIDDSAVPRLKQFLPRPRFVASAPLAYPPRARSARLQGSALVHLTLDSTGRVTDVDYREGTLGRAFQPDLSDWLLSARFDVPPGWPRPGQSPTVEMRVAFGLADGGDCTWDLPPLPEGVEDLRLCGSRVR